MRHTLRTFDDMIAPTSSCRFLADFWEQQFLHIRKGDRSFEHLFSIRDVDAWMAAARTGPRDSITIAAPEGAETGMKKYRPDEIGVDSVYDSFAKGHSVVLNYLESSWPPLFPLVKLLGAYFYASIGVNAYLTPRGKRTFPVHVDDHDVFILQVSGTKVWRLHQLTVLSVTNLKYGADLEYPADWSKGRLESPLLAELRLQPGDVLYIPRGMPHCAKAKDATSLHLTISIVPIFWAEFLRAAVEDVAIRAPELRRALTPGFMDNPQAAEAMRGAFDAAMKAFHEQVSYESTLRAMQRHRIRQQGYPLDGHFAEIDGSSAVGADSMVQRRAGILCMFDDSEPGYCKIRFGARQIRGPLHRRDIFEFIQHHPRFVVHEIPGDDLRYKVALVRRLIHDGLLRSVDQAVNGNGRSAAISSHPRPLPKRRLGKQREQKV